MANPRATRIHASSALPITTWKHDDLLACGRSLTTEHMSERELAPGIKTVPFGAVWIVTQPFHGRRARRCFRRAGLDARVWPIVDGIEEREPSRALRWIAREYAAWLRELTR